MAGAFDPVKYTFFYLLIRDLKFFKMSFAFFLGAALARRGIPPLMVGAVAVGTGFKTLPPIYFSN
jgi:hypothetical protein